MRRWLFGIGIGVLATMTACGSGSGTAGGAADAGERLTEQRTELRSLALDLAPALAEAVGGRVTFMHGEWQGCNIVEQYLHRNFHYAVSGRIDADGLDADSVAQLSQALADAGFTIAEPEELSSGRVGFDAERDGVSAGGSVYLEDPFVLFGFAGPCIDVPESEREEWERKRDEDKTLVPGGGSSGG